MLHGDIAFLYNPFSIEEEPPSEGSLVSILSGWASDERMKEFREYIEKFLPDREGRVYHTFALYRKEVCSIGNTEMTFS